MAEEQTKREIPARLAWGVTSLAMSFTSHAAFASYIGLHEGRRRLIGSEEILPWWLTGRAIDGMKLASVVFAFAAFALAIETLRRKRWLIGVLALIVSLLCLLTVPMIT